MLPCFGVHEHTLRLHKFFKRELKPQKEGRYLLSISSKDYEEDLTSRLEGIEKFMELSRMQCREFQQLFRSGSIQQKDLLLGSLLEVVQNAVATLPSSLAKRTSIDPSLHTKGLFHPIFLSNILKNLINHAHFYAHATLVEVGFDPALGEMYLRSDGQGIPRAMEPYLFSISLNDENQEERFMELAFIAQLMQAMQGSIRFENFPRGAAFFLSFSKR